MGELLVYEGGGRDVFYNEVHDLLLMKHISPVRLHEQ